MYVGKMLKLQELEKSSKSKTAVKNNEIDSNLRLVNNLFEILEVSNNDEVSKDDSSTSSIIIH